jgi:hypothetical protein
MLLDHRLVLRILGRSIRPRLGTRRLLSFDPPAVDEVHGLIDQVAGIEGRTLEGVFATILANLCHVPAGVIKGLSRPVPVENLSAASSHLPRVEGAHVCFLWGST